MLQSTALPAALLEVATILSNTEKALTTPQNNVQVAYDFESLIATVTASLPITVNNATPAHVALVPVDYAPVADFNATAVTGLTGGASINNPSLALLKIATAIDAAEKAKVAAGGSIPEGVGVALTADLENLRAGLSIDVPFAVAISGGQQVLSAVNYLA